MRTARIALFSLALALMCTAAIAQPQPGTLEPTPPAPVILEPQPAGIMQTMKAAADPDLIAYAAFVHATIARGATDWTWTGPSGRAYHVSARNQTLYAGAILGGSLALAHVYPRARKPIRYTLYVVTGILAGAAYANAQGH